LSDIPVLKISNTKSFNEKFDAIVTFLLSRGNAKPRKIATLKNAINALFMKTLDAEELEKLIAELTRKNLISPDKDNKVHYNLTT
jgi:hypothetical protein